MTWAETQDAWYSFPYRIYRTTQGFDAWIYRESINILNRGYRTLPDAKAACEAHAARELA